jgi:hypothetical protein
MVGFSGRVRQWRDDKPGGLAVVDIPTDLVAALGGRRQMRVTGNLNEAPFTGEHDARCRRRCVGVSRAALTAANAAVGDEVQLSITATHHESSARPDGINTCAQDPRKQVPSGTAVAPPGCGYRHWQCHPEGQAGHPEWVSGRAC